MIWWYKRYLTYTTLSKFYRNRNSSSNVICHRVQFIFTILAFKFFIISNHKNSIVFRTNIFNFKWNVQISFTLYNLILAQVVLSTQYYWYIRLKCKNVAYPLIERENVAEVCNKILIYLYEVQNPIKISMSFLV